VKNQQANKFYQILQKQFSRRINLDLSRIKYFLFKKKIYPNQIRGKIITVKGSDGKNSVVQSLKTILIEDGKKITTFTSPGILSVLDRIFIKDRFISLNKFKVMSKEIIKSKIKLTLFEAITLIYVKTINKLKGFHYHIVEAGAGWEKDSTNLWENPRAQIVTNINLQHLDLFKVKTLTQVIKIKVGFLSKNTVIYIGKQKPNVLKKIKQILKSNPSKKYYYGHDFRLTKKKDYYIYQDKLGKLSLKSNQIFSDGLWDNIALTIKVARDLKIKNKIILKAIPKIYFQGRLEYIKKGKLRKFINPNEDLLLDGGASITAAKNANTYLKKLKKPIYGIWAIQKNRNPKMFLKEFQNIFKKIICIKVPNEKNFCSAKKLRSIAKQLKIKNESAKNIPEAIKKISDKKKKLIYMFGSLYTVGKILSLN